MAIIKANYDTNRMQLRDVIPLSGPYTIVVEPTRLCNLHCNFCAHGKRGTEDDPFQQNGMKLAHMDMSLYDKLVTDIMDSRIPQPKVVNFVGMGEPLVNPQLGEMFCRLRGAGFAGRIKVSTNGVLLTPARTEELTTAGGAVEFQISINGLSNEQYKEVTGVDVDFDQLVANIQYLYEHKKTSWVYVKIIDGLLQQESDRERFIEMFSPVADQINVEHFVRQQILMGDYDGKIKYDYKNMHNEVLDDQRGRRVVCPTMFYTTTVDADGYVFPCTKFGLLSRFSIGNLRDKSFFEIWNDRPRLEMLRINLKYGSDKLAMCIGCTAKYCLAAREEYLDDCAEELLARISVEE